jgi:hypothetical protein
MAYISPTAAQSARFGFSPSFSISRRSLYLQSTTMAVQAAAAVDVEMAQANFEFENDVEVSAVA